MQSSTETCPRGTCFYFNLSSYIELLPSHLLVMMDNFAVNVVIVNENMRTFTSLIKIC